MAEDQKAVKAEPKQKKSLSTALKYFFGVGDCGFC
jgi:hypothetical protein